MPRILTVVAALLFALTGCSGAATPASEEPTRDEQFLERINSVGGVGGDLSDEELITAAEDVCFEMDLQLKSRKDFELYWWVLLDREYVPPADTPLFLAAAMKTYCPEMERFRPDLTA